MSNIIKGTFLLFHGLVHIWFFVLAARLVEFKTEMGWTGKSWLLSGIGSELFIQKIAMLLYLISTVLFILSAFGIWFQSAWQEKLLLISAIVSSFTILLFFDGSFRFIIPKGVIGLIINAIIILWLSWRY